MADQVMEGGKNAVRRLTEVDVPGKPPQIKHARPEVGGSVPDAWALAPIEMQALQASLLASLKNSAQQMVDAQLS